MTAVRHAAQATYGALLRLFGRLPRRVRRFVVHRVAPSYSVGSMCIVERDDGALLLVRHAYRSRWGVPGGLLNRGEGPSQAARREAAEEVGLHIELAGEPQVVVEPRARRVDVVFLAAPAAGATADGLRPRSPEIVEVRWFHPAELPELQAETAGALLALDRAGRRPLARPHRLRGEAP